MTAEQLKALEALRFNWAPVVDDVWRPAPFHVEGLHRATERMVLHGVDDARRSADASPIGLALQGQRGTGKTHLLGWVREQVHARDGYFFLVSLLDAEGFWASVVQSLDEGLSRSAGGKETQLRTLLRDLGDRIGAPRALRRAVAGDTTLTRESLDAFIELLSVHDPLVGRECQETARALALLASDSAPVREVGETYLQSISDDHNERPGWGMRRTPRPPELIVRDLSWLLALSGPTVIAVDQIDTLIAQSVKSLNAGGSDGPAQDAVLERVAGGLMSLRQRTRRTLTLLACIPSTWQLIKDRATDTVQDRFREATQLKTIPSTDVARGLVEKRFTWHFDEMGYTPPYPSWPVRPDAFDGAVGFTPRQLLIKIDAHIQACLAAETASELGSVGAPPAVEPSPPRVLPSSAAEPALAEIDARYAQLATAADPAAVLAADLEDAAMPPLLAAGLQAWVLERGEAAQAYSVDPPPGPRPALHARLRLTLDESTEDQVHWGFRAIGSPNAVAALNRLRKACTAAGLTDGVPKRKLFLLRNPDWSRGAATQAELMAFYAAGGKDFGFDNRDVRSLKALQTLLEENPPNLHAWLLSRKPASGIEVFRQALGDGDAELVRGGEPVEPAIRRRRRRPEPLPCPHDAGTGDDRRNRPPARADPSGPSQPGPQRTYDRCCLRQRRAGIDRAGGAAQAHSHLRRLRLRQDRPHQTDHRGVRTERRVVDRAGSKQRSRKAGRSVAGATGQLGAGRRPSSRGLPRPHRRGDLDTATGGGPAAQLPPAARVPHDT